MKKILFTATLALILNLVVFLSINQDFNTNSYQTYMVGTIVTKTDPVWP